MVKIAIIYHSSQGHTKIIADYIAQGVNVVGVELIMLTAAEAKRQLKLLDDVHAIIFGSPTYFGSVSAEFKAFMDATSMLWLEQKWKNKIAAAFTCANSANGDQSSTIMQLFIFAAQHAMIWTGVDLITQVPQHGKTSEVYNRLGSWIGYTSNARNEHGEAIDLTPVDIAAAKHFGQRIVEITQKFNT